MPFRHIFVFMKHKECMKFERMTDGEEDVLFLIFFKKINCLYQGCSKPCKDQLPPFDRSNLKEFVPPGFAHDICLGHRIAPVGALG